jgi:hypothetical protein
MDLRKQPKVIKVLMVKTVLKALENRGKYNHIKFLQFCGKHDLAAISDRIEEFVPMLAI